jgi:hypothetical protein
MRKNRAAVAVPFPFDELEHQYLHHLRFFPHKLLIIPARNRHTDLYLLYVLSETAYPKKI